MKQVQIRLQGNNIIRAKGEVCKIPSVVEYTLNVVEDGDNTIYSFTNDRHFMTVPKEHIKQFEKQLWKLKYREKKWL